MDSIDVEDEDKKNTKPIIDYECPECGHGKAYYSAMQMRSADEGQTIIYECVKCKYENLICGDEYLMLKIDTLLPLTVKMNMSLMAMRILFIF